MPSEESSSLASHARARAYGCENPKGEVAACARGAIPINIATAIEVNRTILMSSRKRLRPPKPLLAHAEKRGARQQGDDI
jgi:hypothetical protein